MKTTLYLDECPESVLSNLPENMEVRGVLNLWYCQSFKSLPEGLKVGGELNLDHCIKLESLPEGLKVGGGLWLYDCTSLTFIPEGLKVGGIIRINRYTLVKKEDFPKRLWKKIKEIKEG